jgi:spoIIIJ-associated protein
MLRLEPDDHDRVSFDANGYKAARAHAIRDAADAAIDEVEDTGEPFRFQPMNSRERRMLHLFLRESGLQTASSGEGPRRFVVLYPEGYRIPVERPYERSAGRSNGRSSDRRGGPSRNRY